MMLHFIFNFHLVEEDENIYLLLLKKIICKRGWYRNELCEDNRYPRRVLKLRKKNLFFYN